MKIDSFLLFMTFFYIHVVFVLFVIFPFCHSERIKCKITHLTSTSEPTQLLYQNTQFAIEPSGCLFFGLDGFFIFINNKYSSLYYIAVEPVIST